MDETSSSTESAQSKESSSETSERESLQSEAQESLSTEISARAAGGFSASYGPVTAEASAETAFSTTASASSSSSVEFAKTVLQKAAEKVSKTRVETIRRSRKVRSEESSKTGFDNAGGPNRTAIYRWVDEIHESRLLNYGSRMMLEFLVPKPGAVLLWSESEAAEQDMPQPQPAPDISLEDFEPEQVDDLIEEYGLVDPPLKPEPYVFVSKTFKFNDELKAKTDNRANILLIDSSMVVPEGYTVLKLRIYVDATMPRDNILGGSGDKDNFKNARYLARVGSHTVKLKGERSQGKTFIQDAESDQWVIPRNGSIPVSLTGLEDRSGTLTVVLGCVPSPGLIHKWKVAFLGAIQTEWRRRVSDYEDRLREARRRQPASTVGRNPAANRALERTELKRGTISILTAQHFELFGALDRPEDGPPRIRFREAAAEGRYVEFFERAFEWHNMDYLLYPYFWSHPGIDWKPALQTKMDDPLHEQFLRAGFARVVIPVRPGFEGAVITYLEHPDRAVLWNGMDYEQIDIQSDLHFSIWQAQMELQGRLSEEPEQEGEPWRFRIATEHQIISASAQLPAPPVPPVNPAP